MQIILTHTRNVIYELAEIFRKILQIKHNIDKIKKKWYINCGLTCMLTCIFYNHMDEIDVIYRKNQILQK